MANHFRLFGRPVSQDAAAQGLRIEGVLDGYTVGEAYSSGLAIVGAVGKCHVEVLESSLPSGAGIRADNVAKRIVVSWPGFSLGTTEPHDVQNGQFVDGFTYWTPSQGWVPDTTYGYQSGQSARFETVRGEYELLGTRVPATPKQSINLAAQVQQGATSKKKAGAEIFLRWYDAKGNTIKEDTSTRITSGKKGNWSEARIYGTAPNDAVYVAPGARAVRLSQNNPVWVDAFTWDHKYMVGTNSDYTYTLSIKVTDSTNQVAYWQGSIDIKALYLTSDLYNISPTVEQVSSGMRLVLARLSDTQTTNSESLSSGMKLASATIDTVIAYKSVGLYESDVPALSNSMTLSGGVLTTVIAYKSVAVSENDIPKVTSGMRLVSGTLQTVIAYKTVSPYDVPAVTSGMRLISATLN